MAMADLSTLCGVHCMPHLAVALNGVRLNHEAAEGRRLAEKASRIKSRVLSMVSHELRTPLGR